MRTITALTMMVITAAALAQPAAAQTNTVTSVPKLVGRPFSDTFFLQRAAADSLLEIQLGTLAQTNSQNSAVQQFGATLVADHTAALQQAQELATALGTTLPSLNSFQQLQLQRLSSLTGDQFDRALIATLIAGHRQDILQFENAAIKAQNADVRAFARNQLPVLMQHLVMALEIRETLLNSQAVTQGQGTAGEGTTGGDTTNGGTTNGGTTNGGTTGG